MARAVGALVAEDGALDVDEGRLEALARLMAPASFQTVLESFLSASEPRLLRIEAGVAGKDLSAVALEAHDLKGVSGNFGACRLQGLAEHLERAAKSGDAEAARSIVPRIRQAQVAVNGRLAERVAAGEAPGKEIA